MASKKFTFRLQSVLDFRAQIEEQAKHEYRESQVRRLQAEAQLDMLDDTRAEIWQMDIRSIGDVLTREAAIFRVDDQEAELRIVIDVLTDEEMRYRDLWMAAKRDLEVLVKLREKYHEEWRAEQDRLEQQALDEWTITRRAA